MTMIPPMVLVSGKLFLLLVHFHGYHDKLSIMALAKFSGKKKRQHAQYRYILFYFHLQRLYQCC